MDLSSLFSFLNGYMISITAICQPLERTDYIHVFTFGTECYFEFYD